MLFKHMLTKASHWKKTLQVMFAAPIVGFAMTVPLFGLSGLHYLLVCC